MRLHNSAARGLLCGYASVFHVSDFDRDIVVPGAFRESLKKRLPSMRWQHGASIIGTWTHLQEDDVGLYAKGQLNLETPEGKQAYGELLAGNVKGLSIGFSIQRATQRNGHRYLIDVDLHEISLVANPCNPYAEIDHVKYHDSRLGRAIYDMYQSVKRHGRYVQFSIPFQTPGHDGAKVHETAADSTSVVCNTPKSIGDSLYATRTQLNTNESNITQLHYR